MTPEKLSYIEERAKLINGRQYPTWGEMGSWGVNCMREVPELCQALREAWATIKELEYHLETCKKETENLL